MPRERTYSKVTRQAARLLGKQIKLGRKRRHWSESELADRAGVARATVQKVENGGLSCALGLVFELASLVGVKLFDAPMDSLRKQITETDERIALLPKHTHRRPRKIHDDF